MFPERLIRMFLLLGWGGIIINKKLFFCLLSGTFVISHAQFSFRIFLKISETLKDHISGT